MIPELTGEGTLPPGIHEATLEEVRRRFGRGNRARVELMAGLAAVTTRAMRAGGLSLYLNGSFVTSKKEPIDWDAVLVVPVRFNAASEDGSALANRETIRAEHGGDLYVLYEDDAEAIDHLVNEVFAHDRQMRPKGILLISLKAGR